MDTISILHQLLVGYLANNDSSGKWNRIGGRVLKVL